jgi:hypothetical protein
MPRENLEIVRRYVEGWGSLTGPGLVDHTKRFWDPDGDYYPIRNFPEARPCHGEEEISRFNAGYRASWESLEFKVKALIEVGDDRVLVRTHQAVEGPGSGAALAGDVYHCLWLRNGRILRMEDHLTPEGALKGFGLDVDSPEAAELRD